MADMKAAGATSFDQFKAMPEAVSDSVKHVTFAVPVYVPVLRACDPLVGDYASIDELNQLSASI